MGVKISNLPNATVPLTGAELAPVVQGGVTSKAQLFDFFSGNTGSAYVGFLQSGTGATARTVEAKLRDVVSVKDFGAVGDGVTDDTAAINAAIAYVDSLAYGGEVYFPVGSYAVTEINATALSQTFFSTLKLRGAGRWMTRIIPKTSGNVLLNLLGRDDASVEDMTFDSSALVSQCAIFLARSTTSTNCNNNKFKDLFFEGSYSIACVVCNGSESSNWFNCRLANVNVSASYRCFWSGGNPGITALQNVTVVNGGTILDTNNPNTDNKMFGVEFYAPYSNAIPVRFSISSSYHFFGCAVICGTSDNVKMVSYGDPTGGRFNGPIAWIGCHFEGFGSNNVCHYLNGGAASILFDGISSYGGYYVLSNNTSVIDYDRTNISATPQMQSSTWTSPTTAPNSTNTKAYVWALYSCNFAFKPSNTDGYLYVTGYAINSVVDATYYLGGATRFVSCYHTTVATALPTTGTYTVGETIQRETPVVGQPTGWKCTVSGTLGTLNGGATTGSIAINTNVLTVNTATGLSEGQRINVAGSTGGPYYVQKLSGTTVYLDSNAGATVAGAAVSFSNATLVAMANL